jgi:4-diphosphocytidyl-2-C-methyl-D-erythritol kinase
MTRTRSESSGIFTLSAPAKVNLTLEVIGRRPDGYHAIRSVFVRLPRLADTVRVRVDDGPTAVRIRASGLAIPLDHTNIGHRAAVAFLDRIRRRARVAIELRKRIPVAAGLGGGSSDAAAVLLALNLHFGQPLSSVQLATIGSSIGKDIPFFLSGAGASRVSGAGERLRRIAAMPRLHAVVVNPGIAVSTHDAYAALDRQLWFMASKHRIDRTARMIRAIATGDPGRVAAALYNDFEPVIEQLHPVVRQLRHELLALGACGATMSGSGPTSVGLFPTAALAARAQALLQAHDPAHFIARV